MVISRFDCEGCPRLPKRRVRTYLAITRNGRSVEEIGFDVALRVGASHDAVTSIHHAAIRATVSLQGHWLEKNNMKEAQS